MKPAEKALSMKPVFVALSRDSGAILTERHLKAAGYLMSREQAERVFNGTTAETVTVTCNCGESDCPNTPVDFCIIRNVSGTWSIQIGCVDFTTEDVAKVRQWLVEPWQAQAPAQAIPGTSPKPVQEPQADQPPADQQDQQTNSASS